MCIKLTGFYPATSAESMPRLVNYAAAFCWVASLALTCGACWHFRQPLDALPLVGLAALNFAAGTALHWLPPGEAVVWTWRRGGLPRGG